MPPGEKDKIKFPHLLPGEVTTWRKFLLDHETEYDRFEYDIHLEGGSTPQEAPPDQYAENFRWLTRKRADVIGFKGKHVTIFEIRPRASLPLLGQLQGYRYLWMRQHPESEPPLYYAHCHLRCNKSFNRLQRA